MEYIWNCFTDQRLIKPHGFICGRGKKRICPTVADLFCDKSDADESSVERTFFPSFCLSQREQSVLLRFYSIQVETYEKGGYL